MKTCILKLCFALAWVGLLAIPTASQAQFTYITNGDSTITITGYTGSGGDVTIPGSFNGYPVTSIGAGAFLGSVLTNVTIPNSVITIGNGAFEYCSGLTNVTIGGSVITIGSAAFAYCAGLTSVTIPDRVTNIAADAFPFCYALTNIAVDVANPSYAGAGGVLFNKTLTTLVLYPGGLTGSYAISNSVTNIGADAFASCSGLTNVTIPNSVANIADGAFVFCFGLTSVNIPNSVTSLGKYAFEFCSGLTNVFFQGNAPSVDGAAGIADSSVFYGDIGTVYYVTGTTGWGSTFGGWPTVALAAPQVGGNIGIHSGNFGFTITGATHQTVVIEACADLAHPVWMAIATNTLANGSSAFSDPKWTNYPSRFYRLRSP